MRKITFKNILSKKRTTVGTKGVGKQKLADQNIK